MTNQTISTVAPAAATTIVAPTGPKPMKCYEIGCRITHPLTRETAVFPSLDWIEAKLERPAKMKDLAQFGKHSVHCQGHTWEYLARILTDRAKGAQATDKSTLVVAKDRARVLNHGRFGLSSDRVNRAAKIAVEKGIDVADALKRVKKTAHLVEAQQAKAFLARVSA